MSRLSARRREGAHICDQCGSRMHVVDVLHFGDTTVRKMECDCGNGADTSETVTKRYPPVATPVSPLQPAATGSHPLQPVATGATRQVERTKESPPLTAAQPPVASAGGVGGALSSGLELSPQSLSHPDQIQTPARRKAKANVEYPPEFEREWDATAKTGSKYNAFTAWETLGRPQLASAWVAWSRLDGWRRGFVPHVSTWLNDRRFEQEPVEVVKSDGNARTRRAVETARDWIPPEQRRAG